MKPEDNAHQCPLCSRKCAHRFFEDAHRPYYRCPQCVLISVPRPFWLSLDEQRATYDLHENDAGDAGYRRFLSRLSVPLLEKLSPNQVGLDFGCGPGPALPALMEAQGHRMDVYDPFYFNDPTVFQKQYDFICATEVVEHLSDPNDVFGVLFNLLRRGGWLGIMTKLAMDVNAFSKWHYIRDRTHICFYSHSTFEYIARRFDAELTFVAKDALLLQKTPRGGSAVL
jgi:hypothetical protein